MFVTCIVMTIESFVLLQGFPDFKPPQFVIDALVESTKDIKCHQYTRGPVCSRFVRYY